MKVAYLSQSSFSDVDLSLLTELQNKADVTYLLYLYPQELRRAAVNIGQPYKQNGVFPAEIYSELEPLSKALDKTRFKVVTANKNRFFSYARLKASFKLFFHILKEKYDIIHLTFAPPISMLWLYMFRKKLVLTVHDPIPHSSTTSRSLMWERNWAMSNIGHFVLLKENQEEAFKKLYGLRNDQQVSISRLSSYNYLSLYNEKNTVKGEYILFFGRIASYKGLQILLPAMERVHLNHPNVRLVIAGSGKFSVDVSRYEVLDYIEIRNRFIPDNELAGLIKGSLFVVAPYIDATQSGVVMSAFAFNKPCLVTNVGGLPEMVGHGQYGMIAEPSDEDSLVNSIDKLLSDREMLNEYSENINTDYRQGKYSWDHISDEYVDVFNNVISH